MNPNKKSPLPTKLKSKPSVKLASTEEEKRKNNIDLKKLLPKVKKYLEKLVAHLAFIVIMAALLVYFIVIWQIRSLVTAEPSLEDESLALSSAKIPKINPKAIQQIQSLEENSPKIKAFFDDARNNPFYELKR
jgi:predicted PurR-regulated permease PerM